MKKNLLAGLSTLIPFVVTLWILKLLFRRFTAPFVALMKKGLVALHFHPNMLALTLIAHLLIFCLLVVLTCLVGYIGSHSSARSWIHRWHNLVMRIPFLRLVYEPIYRLAQLVLDPNKKVFEAPKSIDMSDGAAHAIGLRTISEPLAKIESHLGSGVEVILLPGVPNPLIGFVLFVKKKAHRTLSMSIEETITFLVSCGLLHPKGGK